MGVVPMARRLLLVVAVSMSVLGLGAERSPVQAGEVFEAEARGPVWAPTCIGLGWSCDFSFDSTACTMGWTSTTAVVVWPPVNACTLRVSGTLNVTTSGIACGGFGNGVVTLFDSNLNLIRTVPVVFEAAAGSIAWVGYDPFVDGEDAVTSGTLAGVCQNVVTPGQMTGTFTATKP